MIGALDFVSRELIVATSRTKRGSDVIALLERLDRIHGPNIDDARLGGRESPPPSRSTTSRSIQAEPRVMRSPRVRTCGGALTQPKIRYDVRRAASTTVP
jgi:hypothetical protein